MAGNVEQAGVSLDDRARLIEDSINKRIAIIKELEKKETHVRISLEKLQANVGSRVTPVEWLIGVGLLVTASVCVTVLFLGFRSFNEALLRLVEQPSLWNQSRGIGTVTMYGGQATLAQAEWPASALAWVSGLGFAALAAAIAVVALGASVAFSRIRNPKGVR
jgi:hypothetical protein